MAQLTLWKVVYKDNELKKKSLIFLKRSDKTAVYWDITLKFFSPFNQEKLTVHVTIYKHNKNQLFIYKKEKDLQ